MTTNHQQPTTGHQQPPPAFGGCYRGKRILLTGHTGFKGAWLAEWLLSLGAEVTGIALPPPTKPSLFDQLGLASRLRHIEGDVRDLAAVRAAFAAARPDFVFHLAAQPLVRLSYEQPAETFAANVMGTANVLEAARLAADPARPCAVVAVTTDKCYENREWVHSYREEDPMGGYDPYSASKGAAELVIASYRRSFFSAPGCPVRLASARAGNVIGGGDWALDRIVPDCIRALAKGDSIPVRNKVATRPWQHVLEPLSGYLWLGAALAAGGEVAPRLVNDGSSLLGSEKPSNQQPATNNRARSANDGSSLLGSESNNQQLTTNNPPPASDAPVSPFRFPPSVYQSAFNFGPSLASNKTVAELVQEILKHWPGRWDDKSDPHAPHEAKLLNLATDKAHHLLGWAPAWPFAETIAQTVRWYREAGALLDSDREVRTPRASHALTTSQIAEYTAAARAAGIAWAQ